MRGIRLIQIACASTLVLASSAFAGKNDTLASCMWQKMPSSTAAFVENSDPAREFSLFLKAMAPCPDGTGNISLTGLKKTLAKMRPAAVGPDVETADNAFVCPKNADGSIAPCKSAGE